MRIQVVHCHPLTDSFDHALYLAILEALRAGGHDVVGTVTIGGNAYPLAARETIVLELLLRHSGNVAPKRTFEHHLFGLSSDGSLNAIEVYVSRLRKVLANAGATVTIHTVRGVGYLLSRNDCA